MAEMHFDASEDDLKVWLAEADEQIETLQNDVISLEKDYTDTDLVARIFRAAHTLKGSSGMIGHKRMTELTHAMESVFGTVRDGKLVPSADVVDAILRGVDGLTALREEVVTKQERTDLDIEPAVQALLRIVEAAGGIVARMPGSAAAADGAHGGSGAASAGAAPALTLDEDELATVQDAIESGAAVWVLEIDFEPTSEWLAVRAFQALNDLAGHGELLKSKPTAEEIDAEQVGAQMQLVMAGDPSSADAITEAAKGIDDVKAVRLIPFVPHAEAPAAAPAAPVPAEPQLPVPSATTAAVVEAAAPAAAAAAVPARQVERATQNVRVDVERLDRLMNLVGELVIERNRLLQLGLELEAQAGGARDAIDSLNEAGQSLGRITDELQEEVMSVRMQPIEVVFNKFPRLVRDLARTLEKKIDLVIEGKETELDRSVIEKIDDPIIHLIRNAADHGMEMPDERRAVGKPETGTIKLSAWHEENHIVIAVQDDGPGIDPDKLKASAVRKGVITQEVADRMDEKAAVELIFAPGFSTAAKTTEVSGRGVGMDIVRSNIEKLSGSVTPESNVGRGTRFLIKLPLTLAIIPALLVEVGGRKFAIPMTTVETTLRLDASEVRTVKTREAIQLRGRILPLVSLRDLLHLPLSRYPLPKPPKPPIEFVSDYDDGGAALAAIGNGNGNGHANGNGNGHTHDALGGMELMPYGGERRLINKMFVVVVKVGDRQMGLQVDQLIGEQEIVIKPLSRFLGEVRGIAGVTILGDGQVAIICDIPSLINRVVQEQLLA